MNVKSIERNGNEATIVVEIDKDLMESGVNKAYLKARKQIMIPGFRKGKAPRKMIEAMYGAHVFYEDGLEEIFPEVYDFAVAKQEGLKAIGRPSLTDMQIGEDGSVTLTLTTEVYPEVTLGQYKGLEVEKADATVTDEQVQAELDRMAQNVASTETVERAAQMGDTANIDFDGFLNGERFDGGKAEGYDLELGSNSFVPGFEEQIVGMQIGEEKDLDITFPEEYVEELAGKAVVFKVKLNSLTVSELPELDDEFAKDVSEFDTLDEYKADIRTNLEKRRQDEAEEKVRSEIMHKAAENMTVEIPDVMVQEKVEEILRNYAANFGLNSRDMDYAQLMQMMGLDENTVNVSIRPGAQVQVKNDLLIEAVIKAENIEVSDEEVEEYLNKVAESIQAQPEEVKNYFGLEFLAGERKKEKATNLIIDSAVITEAAPEEEKAE